jgi:hypothetical protein
MAFDRENIKWFNGSHGLPEAYYKMKVPSVSAILSLIPDPEFEAWIASMGKERVDEIMKQAGYRGTAMHAFIEVFINTLFKTKDVSVALSTTQTMTPPLLQKEEVPDNKILEGRELFYKFYYSDFPSEYTDLMGTELGIHSKRLFFRGKLDILFKDRVYGPKITDFKTSSGYIKKDSVKEYKYKCQLGGYALGLDEMFQEKGVIINAASILCVNTKSDILQEIECSGAELQEYKEKFKTLAINWHKQNGSESLIQL